MPRAFRALVLAAALLPGAAAAGQDAPGEGPRYGLPDGFPRGDPLEEPLRSAVARAVAAVTRPSTPWAARDGWRVLAGIGPRAAPAAVEALRGAGWLGRALLVRALGSMEEPLLEPVLLEAARDPAWAVREAAAEGLGLARGEASAGVLPGLLGDDSWRVRRAAVEALRERALLGGIPAGDACRALLPLDRDPDPDVRRSAWLAVADLRDPAGRTLLLGALRGLADRVQGTSEEEPEDPLLRVALRVLRGLSEGSGGDPEVLDLLRGFGETPWHPLAGPALREWFRLRGPEGASDAGALGGLVAVYLHPNSDPESRASAEEALVDLGEPAAAALLERVARPERATRSPYPPAEFARQALKVVLRVRGARASEALAGVLANRDLPNSIRVHAAELGRRSCAAALGEVFLEVLARDEGSPGLDAQCLRGAAASGTPSAGEVVARKLVAGGSEGPPPSVRAAAAEVLQVHPSLRDYGAVRRALAAEGDPEVLARLLPVAAGEGGAAAARTIAPFLGDRRVRVRREAAQALSRVPGEEATRLLLRALEAEDGRDDRIPLHGEPAPVPEGPGPGEGGAAPPATEEERRRAEERREEARREAEAGAREREAILRANAGTVRESAVSSLRFTAGAGAREVLVPLLEHGDPAVRAAAAGNLATLGDGAAAAAIAARARGEREPGLRPKLLAALADLGGPGAEAAFEEILAGGDEELRVAALDALSGPGPVGKARAPRGALLCARRADASPGERLAALRALGRSGSPEATALLLGVLEKGPGEEERRAAMEALGTSRDPAAAGPLAALLPPGDPGRLTPDELDTVSSAVETLGQLRAPEAAAPLAALLGRALPGALEGGGGRAAAACREVAVNAVSALGRCGGETALDALLRAAFHPALSREAEAATADPLRLGPPRKEGERWRADLPESLRPFGSALVQALARWKDADLLPAAERRLADLRSDGRLHAVSEEWLSLLAAGLGEPPEKAPNRPRWWTKVLLLRQVLANPPRRTEADLEAARVAFTHEAEISREYAAARRTLAAWRECLRIQDPVRADREGKAFDALDAAAVAAEALRTGAPGAAGRALVEAFERSGREERVARLGVEILTDLGKDLETAEALGEAAVGADAGYAPNLRALGVARLHRGNGPGAVEALAAALEELDGALLGPSRGSAWYRYFLARALLLSGRKEEALASLGTAASLNDAVLDWIEKDPSLEPLREGGRLEEALAPARRAFSE